jgi:hypothetical protein
MVDCSIYFSQIVFEEIGTHDVGEKAHRARCVVLEDGVEVREHFSSFQLTELNVPKEALHHHVPKDPLEEVGHVELDFRLAVTRCLSLNLFDLVPANLGNQLHLRLQELVVEHVTHNLLFHFPLVALTEQKSISKGIYGCFSVGTCHSFYVESLRFFFIKFLNKFRFNEVHEYFPINTRQSNLIFG